MLHNGHSPNRILDTGRLGCFCAEAQSINSVRVGPADSYGQAADKFPRQTNYTTGRRVYSNRANQYIDIDWRNTPICDEEALPAESDQAESC